MKERNNSNNRKKVGAGNETKRCVQQGDYFCKYTRTGRMERILQSTPRMHQAKPHPCISAVQSFVSTTLLLLLLLLQQLLLLLLLVLRLLLLLLL